MDAGGGDVVEALVVSLVVVVIDKGFDLGFEITRQEVVFQQDAVLRGLVPSFDLALGLRSVRRIVRVLHAFERLSSRLVHSAQQGRCSHLICSAQFQPKATSKQLLINH